ncbi:Uncharacterized membrane protein YhfC [Fictibacillus solisalsi]|uniref:Uncharacterized membrane protein YhfC n=1 Tax=Fictibacillus solisalsi TaxID=459525 RepID=A0A1H0A3D2_9BACL|nr:YhfC family intramembrane metalloprotease [Fictibacillus solisalsi]SDN27503.1 Uncharacterized membrane protein YhfC [Fictibacillus solisalsi]
MVSQTSIIFMILAIIVSIAVPVITLIYFRRKQAPWKPVLIGILIFILFSQVLEKFLHVYVLNTNTQAAELMKNSYLYAFYGGLAAGIFEEFGRYVGFCFLLKKYREWKDGIAYGIGHGGIEAILIGAFAAFQNILMANLINSGGFERLAGAPGQDPNILMGIKDQLVNTSSYMFLLGGFERIAAFVLQIALSIIVLYAVKSKKPLYLLYAILIHAAIDFVAVLSKSLEWSVWIPEGMLLVIALLSIVFIKKSKSWFDQRVDYRQESPEMGNLIN